jgi:hypothetical protein
MSHHRLHVCVALALWLSSGKTDGSFGPGEAGAHSASQRAGERVAEKADFKVLVWYRKRDPLGTFKYEIYDVRKGEYTAEVDEWIKDVQTKFPGYYVVKRNVDLSRETGQTELLKVGSVISRELAVAAGSAGIVIGPGRSASSSLFTGAGTGPRNTGSQRGPSRRGLPGATSRDRDYLTPPATPFPIPVPFPRLPR